MNEENATDVLAPAPGARLVNWAYLAAALRRRRKAILATALVGGLLGLGLGVLVPKRPVASTTVLLSYPDGTDLSSAMDTDVQLLQTRAVADAAARSLHLNTKDLLSKFRGTVLGQRVVGITASGPSAAEASRRVAAVTTAFLAFRTKIYEDQLAVKVAALQQSLGQLKDQLKQATDNATIGTITSQIGNVQGAIQNAQVSTGSVAKGSEIINPAAAAPSHALKTATLDLASGLIAGSVLAMFVVVLLALVSTRVRRRADIAATMRAPVALSVGPVVPQDWRRLIRKEMPTPGHPSSDLQLIARHLQSVLGVASAPALVVVAIDNLRVATLSVQTLAARLTAQGHRVSIVNESGRPIAVTAPTVEVLGGNNVGTRDDIVLVLAVLDPAKGAEHLREWSADAVVFVTAGRSTAAKLDANAAMIRSAALHLHSVVLIGADRTDESLGIFDETVRADVHLRTVDPEDAASARPSLP